MKKVAKLGQKAPTSHKKTKSKPVLKKNKYQGQLQQFDNILNKHKLQKRETGRL